MVRRWWWRPNEEVFWRLSVGVAGSLKFSGIAQVGNDDPSQSILG